MSTPSRTASPLILTLLLLAMLAVLAFLLPRLHAHLAASVDDFVEYWAAGRLNAHGLDPYSPPLLFELEHAVGWPHDEPVMMWNPPWTLPLVMPFGLLPYPTGRLAWLLFNVALMLLGVELVWNTYGGAADKRWMAWLAAFLFCPTIISLRMGQSPPVMLAGIAAFLFFFERDRPFLAGMCLALAAIKPQQTFLMWIALALWSLHGRHFRILLGAGLVLAAGTLAALAANPLVLAQYHHATLNHPPLGFISNSFGTVLRLALGWHRSYLQFVPTVLGAFWLLAYWYRKRNDWSWRDETPLLLIVSICASTYGWLGDQAILLVAILPMAIAIVALPDPARRIAIAAYFALNLILFILNATIKDLAGFQELMYLWTAPAILLTFLKLRPRIEGRPDASTTPLPVEA